MTVEMRVGGSQGVAMFSLIESPRLSSVRPTRREDVDRECSLRGSIDA